MGMVLGHATPRVHWSLETAQMIGVPFTTGTVSLELGYVTVVCYLTPFTYRKGGDQMYIGLDVHKKHVYATVKRKDGRIVEQRNFENDKKSLQEFVASLRRGKHHAVLEASSSWMQTYDFLEAQGIDVCLAHPLKLRAIAEERIKNDRIDSETLAELLRLDGIPKCWVPPAEIRELRNITRHRASLTRTRTQIKNEIHSLLAKKGVKAEFSDLFGKEGIEFLKSLKLNTTERTMLTSYLKVLEPLTNEIAATSRYITLLANRRKEVQLLLTIPGINVYSAMLILAEIGDIKRFRSAGSLCCWAGLVTSVYKSDETVYYGRITKQGSKWLRWILAQCAYIAIRHPGRIRDFYLRVEKRRGNKVAIVATARKMLRIIYYMLTRNEPYRDADKLLTIRKQKAAKREARDYPVEDLDKMLESMEEYRHLTWNSA